MSVDLKVYSWDGNAKKTATKTFKGIDANAATANNNAAAIALAQKYDALTDSATASAELITTADLDLD